MSTTTQIVISIVCELVALVCGIGLLKHKDADQIMQFTGLFTIIGVSLVILIEVGLAISWAVNPQ